MSVVRKNLCPNKGWGICGRQLVLKLPPQLMCKKKILPVIRNGTYCSTICHHTCRIIKFLVWTKKIGNYLPLVYFISFQFAIVEVIVTSIQDGFPRAVKKYLICHELLVLVVCFASFLLGLPLVTQVCRVSLKFYFSLLTSICWAFTLQSPNTTNWIILTDFLYVYAVHRVVHTCSK